MVDYGYDPDYGNLWDIHNVPEQNYPHVSQMCLRGYNVAGIDRAFAALIADLRERGRLDSTLVVFLTEFGRTPKINALGGRDHWGACGSMFFTGAGVRRGQVIGAFRRSGGLPDRAAVWTGPTSPRRFTPRSGWTSINGSPIAKVDRIPCSTTARRSRACCDSPVTSCY